MSFVDAQPYIFCHLEGTGYLDINDELHMFAIEYVYFPRMNKHLFVFALGWDNPPLCTESNMSPNQLWICGKPMCKDNEIMVNLVNYALIGQALGDRLGQVQTSTTV